MHGALCGRLDSTTGAESEPYREDAERQQVSHSVFVLVFALEASVSGNLPSTLGRCRKLRLGVWVSLKTVGSRGGGDENSWFGVGGDELSTPVASYHFHLQPSVS